MEKEELIKHQDQQVKVFLKNNSIFHGNVREIKDSSLTLVDRYGSIVSISTDDISFILQNKPKEEEHDGRKRI